MHRFSRSIPLILTVALPWLAWGYPLPPQSISFEPAAPAITDRQGDGWCVMSRQVNPTLIPFQGNNLVSVDTVFGSEKSATPQSCSNPNTTEQGVRFPIRLNQFFDDEFFPRQVVGVTVQSKYSRFLDLSSHPYSTDPNGDFWDLNTPYCDAKGCAFPGIPIPNFNRTAIYPANAYSKDVVKTTLNPIWPKMFPESQPDLANNGVSSVQSSDLMRDTATRIRGYINITPERAGRPLVLGCYADDAVAFSFYSKLGEPALIISAASNRCLACDANHPCVSSDPYNPTPPACNAQGWCEPCDLPNTGQRWRVTNAVTFSKPGLYPMEIMHLQFSGNAALECAVKALNPGEPFNHLHQNWGYQSDYNADPARLYGAVGPTLRTLGLSPLDPAWFFQTSNGIPLASSSMGMDAEGCPVQGCFQCKRRAESDPAFGQGCPAGSFCNTAGICQPCNTSGACGVASCTGCAKRTNPGPGMPERLSCVKIGCTYQCLECGQDADCGAGRFCDPKTHTCFSCKTDADCPRGKTCQNQQCVDCNTKDQCAGNSCGCCPGKNKCAVVDRAGTPTPLCVECTSRQDCQGRQVCDPVTKKCVDSIPECNTDSRCGPACQACPQGPGARSHCLNGKVCVQCRSDLDCGGSEYCLSGECVACVTDRHCGPRCGRCNDSQPFCFTATGKATEASCVGCLTDDHCGPGGTCDPKTHMCSTPCSLSCPADKPHCNGNQCTQCLSDAQCDCGKGEYCDSASGTCRVGCEDTGDCQANECCITSTNTCESGRCKSGLIPQGGQLCCNASNPSAMPDPPHPAWHALWIGLLAVCIGLSVAFHRSPKNQALQRVGGAS